MPILKSTDYSLNASFESDEPGHRRVSSPVIKGVSDIANTVIKIPHRPYVPAAIGATQEDVSSVFTPSPDPNEMPGVAATPPLDLSEPGAQELEARVTADFLQKRADFEHELSGRRQKVEHELEQYRQQQLAEAAAQKQTILDKAYQEGLAKGKSAAQSEYTQKSRELMAAIAGLADEKAAILKQSKPEVLKLALTIAHQLVKSEISLNQAVTLNIVAEAIEKVTDNTKIIIRVNRADVEFLKMNQERIAQQLGDVKSLVIQEDSRVETGGCIIETNLGYIDATIQTKFDAIKQAIMSTLEDEQVTTIPRRTLPSVDEPMIMPVPEPENDAHDDDFGSGEEDTDFNDDDDDSDGELHFDEEDDDEFSWDDEDEKI